MDQFSAAGKPASPGDFSARGSASAGQFDTGFEPGGSASAVFAAGASGPGGDAASGLSEPASEQDSAGDRRSRNPSGAAQAWAALGGDPALLGRVSYEHRPGLLPSALPVRELASATVAVCSLAAAEFSCVRARSALLPPVRVDEGAVATAFHSDRLVRVDGHGPAAFAPLSRFWRTADGWVRTHANYPHHRARLLSALGMPDHGPAEDEAAAGRVATELASRRARDVEEVVYRQGGLAVAVRTPDEWASHPQRAAVAAAPLVSVSGLDAAPRAPG